jgi:hypothetical protein
MVQPYTTIQIPRAGILTLNVPREFDGKRLTITIAEAESEALATPAHPNAELLEILLSAPTLSDEELQEFADTRAHLNRWRDLPR